MLKSMELIHKFISFGIVGAVATTIQYVVLITLVRTEASGPLVASTAGFAISALANYALNYRFTFRSKKSHLDALPKFTLVALSGLALNTLIMTVLVHWFVWHYLLSQVVSTGSVLVWNFTLSRVWSFRESVPSSTTS
jgi:putative flippase GtrA